MEEKQLERYLSWIDSEIKLYETYHDSKENRAWTVIAAYVPAVITLGYTATPSLTDNCLAKGGLAVILAFTGICIGCFVSDQYRKQWQADCVVRGLRRAKTLLLADPQAMDKLNRRSGERCLFNSRLSGMYGWQNHWPNFIADQIVEISVKGKNPRFGRAEIPSYGILILATLLAVASLFIVHQKLPYLAFVLS